MSETTSFVLMSNFALQGYLIGSDATPKFFLVSSLLTVVILLSEIRRLKAKNKYLYHISPK